MDGLIKAILRVLKIALVNSFVKLVPAKFEISRLELSAPIGRGLVRVLCVCGGGVVVVGAPL